MDKPLKSVTHDQCDARPTVTFPAAGHYRSLDRYQLILLAGGGTRVCEQLAERPRFEPAT